MASTTFFTSSLVFGHAPSGPPHDNTIGVATTLPGELAVTPVVEPGVSPKLDPGFTELLEFVVFERKEPACDTGESELGGLLNNAEKSTGLCAPI